MSIEVRVEPIDRDIDLIFKEVLSPAARTKTLAAFARQTLAEGQDANFAALGRVPLHETFVDDAAGANEDSVKPDGTITYAFNLLEDLFAWIGEQLVIHSPVRSGRYAASHAFFADGTEIDVGLPAPEAAEYVFLNLQPYSRKIERGLSPQAPDGVYEAVASLAARRFGNVARIRFSYRTAISGSILAYQAAASPTAALSRRGGAERMARSPAIVITLR